MAQPVTDWRDLALCRGVDTSIFFPDASTPGSPFDPYAPARRICAGCPVPTPCLEEAMNTETRDGQRHGMRGKLTPAERKTLARTKERRQSRINAAARRTQ